MNAHIGNVSISGGSLSVYGGQLVSAGPATLTNGGSGMASVVASATGGGGAVLETYAIDLGPGKSYTLPAPPAGHRWYITAMSSGRAQRIVEETGVVGLGILALAAYGGVQAWHNYRTGRWRL